MMTPSSFFRLKTDLILDSHPIPLDSRSPGKMSFPLEYTRVVAPVAPDFIAASLSSHPYLMLRAIFGTRTAQSLSPMVRSLM